MVRHSGTPVVQHAGGSPVRLVIQKNRREFDPENRSLQVKSIRKVVNEKGGGLIRKQHKFNSTEI